MSTNTAGSSETLASYMLSHARIGHLHGERHDSLQSHTEGTAAAVPSPVPEAKKNH
jgi:hypothetical protein